jgi:hypothetical protein
VSNPTQRESVWAGLTAWTPELRPSAEQDNVRMSNKNWERRIREEEAGNGRRLAMFVLFGAAAGLLAGLATGTRGRLAKSGLTDRLANVGVLAGAGAIIGWRLWSAFGIEMTDGPSTPQLTGSIRATSEIRERAERASRTAQTHKSTSHPERFVGDSAGEASHKPIDTLPQTLAGHPVTAGGCHSP